MASETSKTNTGSGAHFGAHNSPFLVLSPVKSANYPPSPTSSRTDSNANAISPTEELSSPLVKPAEAAVDGTPKQRRSSSVSSSGSSTGSPFRFLKLGPIHNGKGEHPDFTEVDE